MLYSTSDGEWQLTESWLMSSGSVLERLCVCVLDTCASKSDNICTQT